MLAGELVAAVPLAQIAAFALPLARLDIRLHRLPNVFTIPAILSSQLALLTASALDSGWLSYVWSLVSAAAVATLGILAARSGAFGMGDVKLLASSVPVLAWFDPFLALLSLATAFVAAAAVSATLAVAGRISWQSRIALGPYLLAGFTCSAALAVMGLM
jgi:leader peptidase (prepilin peptidase) / N-methyltransferase